MSVGVYINERDPLHSKVDQVQGSLGPAFMSGLTHTIPKILGFNTAKPNQPPSFRRSKLRRTSYNRCLKL